MQYKEFMKLVKEQFEKCTKTLGNKSKEYSSENDKLHNFKQAGLLQNISPEKALWGMLTKHHISIQDMIYRLDNKKVEYPSVEYIEEKIGDEINYLLLLKALLIERKNGYAIIEDIINSDKK